MTSPDRTAPHRAAATRALAVMVLAGLGLLAMGLPAYAATSTDLSVTLTNTVATPGKRISYHVVVHNNGSHTARRVWADFTTSAAMKSITFKIHDGYCSRSPRETVCYWNESVKAGG